MLARFNGNVVPFADDATSTNRTVFGGTTQSDALDDNLNADFKKGWEIVGLNDNPTREDFNAMGYTLGALTAYLYEMGISEWNASQNYRIGSRVIGSDGKIYKALTGTIGTPNVNHNPTSDTTNWEWEFKSILDSPTFTGDPKSVTPAQFDNDISIATTAFVQRALGNHNGYVIFNTNQTLNNSAFGKIYESSGSSSLTCTLPSPSACPGGKIVIYNRQGAETLTLSSASGVFYGTNNPIATSTVTLSNGMSVEALSDGTNWKLLNGSGTASLTANGYQKLPSGLIIQWGYVTTNITANVLNTVNINYPISFPNGSLETYSTPSNVQGNSFTTCSSEALSKTGFTMVIANGASQNGWTFRWFAIGY